MRRLALSGAIAAALLTCACSAGSTQPDTTKAPPDSSSADGSDMAPVGSSSTLDCADSIGTDPPGNDLQTVLGVVALPTSKTSTALQTISHPGADRQRLFAKTGLVVRAGTEFELVVPDRVGSHLRIQWGGHPTSMPPSHRVVVPQCPDTGGTGWLVFAGGYWLDHPACLPVVVRAAGKHQSVDIGLGTPCPGQRRPASGARYVQ